MNNQKIIVQVQPYIDYSVRKLCIQPYYNHPKGCPNFNKKDGCPPNSEYFDKVYDLNKPVYAICNIFDLKSHIQRMQQNHPNWSDRQLRCCYYWQNSARKELLKHIKDFYREYGIKYKVNTCPEAMGVDIIKTMQTANIQLEFPPKDITYQIALAGIKI